MDDMNNEKVESEKEADIFASYLLAPYDSLRSYLKEHDLLDKNKINISVNDENLIGGSFLLQVLNGANVLTEISIDIAEGW